MSEVSLEAELGKTSAEEDPQMDCEEEAGKGEESLSEDVEKESVDHSREGGDGDEVLYDINIDSAEEKSDNDVQEEDEDEGTQSVVTCRDSDAAHVSDSVDNGRRETNRPVESGETPEESGHSSSDTKVTFTTTLDNQPLLAFPFCALIHVALSDLYCGDGGNIFPIKSIYCWIDFLVKLYLL